MPIRAAVESINGARFVHDQLELARWRVEIADAQKVKGLAPLACKTDRIDAWLLAELARRELVPAIWLPDPRVRAERERARWRLYLVRHRSSLKQRVHALLLSHGKPCPVSDLFGVRSRQLLARLGLPEPWQGTIEASLHLIDELEREIAGCERELRRLAADPRGAADPARARRRARRPRRPQARRTVDARAGYRGRLEAGEEAADDGAPDPKASPAPDLVERRFVAEAPDRLWLADLTYVPTPEGYLFLAVVMDMCSRKIVGWSMRDDLKAELVVDALAMAVTRRRLQNRLQNEESDTIQTTRAA